MKQREKLLNTYGFDVLEKDENGNLIYREKAVEVNCMVYDGCRLRRILLRE